MRIRPYEERDERAVIDLWKRVFPYHEPRNEPARVITDKLASGHGLFFVAQEDGAVVGTVLGGYDGHRGWVYRLAVDPQRRSRGIGAALMDHLERVLAERGCSKVNLQIHGRNAGVSAFYERIGYRIEDRVSMGKVRAEAGPPSRGGFLEREIVPVLRATPHALSAMLAGLDEERLVGSEGPGTWSAHQIVSHLLHGERTDWMPRVRHILEKGTGEPFAPFDREPPAGPETTRDLLARFTEARRESLDALRGLGLLDEDLERTGVHPALGEVTLRQLLASWAVHDLGHVRQVARVLAKRLAGEIGPWSAYLPVVRETGGDSG